MVRNVVVMVFFTDCNHFFNHRGYRGFWLIISNTINQKKYKRAFLCVLCAFHSVFFVVKQTLQLKN